MAQHTPTGWAPIATAPRDGSLIIAGYWQDGAFIFAAYVFDGVEFEGVDHGFTADCSPLTHWIVPPEAGAL